ncbi:MAG TPA: hypothetical protein PKA20_12705 [Burkholderiaceae bacterium]|mgnify:CR=1 FL=1|nr:hypothetical protein [Burkholderiaceae bacterium]
MTSRRFLLCFLLGQVALFALAALLVSHGKMAFMNAEYPMWKSKETLIRHIGPGGTVLLGDSRAMAAFVPADISEDFVNLALGGATPIESYYLLQALLKAGHRPKTIMLSFAPYHYELADTFWERAAKFDPEWFTKADIIDVLAQAERLDDTRTLGSFLGSPPNHYPLALRLDLPSAYKGDLIPPPRPDRYWLNRRVFDQMLQTRGHHLFGTGERSTGLPDEATGKRFSPSPLMRHYLDRIFAVCAEQGMAVQLVTTPLPRTVAAPLAAVDYPADFNRYIDGLPDSIDKRAARLTFADDTMFGDSSHLNMRGARRFSAAMADGRGVH